jgi:hypothetical protein
MAATIGDVSVKKQPERTVVITDASRSQGEQLRSREIRYVTMMGLRVACLIAGAILISVRPPLLPVWLVLCAAGMVLLPWMAVLIANDRPARTKAERMTPGPARPRTQLTSESTETAQSRIIDPD